MFTFGNVRNLQLSPNVSADKVSVFAIVALVSNSVSALHTADAQVMALSEWLPLKWLYTITIIFKLFVWITANKCLMIWSAFETPCPKRTNQTWCMDIVALDLFWASVQSNLRVQLISRQCSSQISLCRYVSCSEATMSTLLWHLINDAYVRLRVKSTQFISVSVKQKEMCLLAGNHQHLCHKITMIFGN